MDDKLNVNKVNNVQQTRPWDRYDRMYRDVNDSNPKREAQAKPGNHEAAFPVPPKKAAPQKEVKETVTITLERYEQLRKSQERLEKVEQRLRDLTEYKLLSVQADRAVYHVNVDQTLFKQWLAETMQHENVEIRSMEWTFKE